MFWDQIVIALHATEAESLMAAGSELLHRSLAIAAQSLQGAFLLVHTANSEALRFYQTRFGFQPGEIVPNYYKRVQPPDAIVLRKPFA